MKINLVTVATLCIVIIFGGIFLSDTLGYWNTESSKEPIKFDSGEFEGKYNPDDIRGSYSFSDVSKIFDIPLSTLTKAFGLPNSIEASTFKNKELKLMYVEQLADGQEIGNGSVKLFVALYKGLPIYLDGDTYLLNVAVDILKENGNLTDDQIIFLDSHTALKNVKVMDALIDEDKASDKAIEHDESYEQIIKGKTLFKDLIDWGITINQIETAIGSEMPNLLTNVKEYCMENELEFSVVKEELQIFIED